MTDEKSILKKDKRGHGEGSITQRADGTWTARIMIGRQMNGTPKIKALYGKTETEVKRKLREYKKNINNLPNDEIAKLSLSQYMANWLEVYKKPVLKPTSYDRLEGQKEYYIDSALGYIQIQNIRSDDIQKLLTKLSKTYSHSTVKKVYMLLNACFKHAIAKNDLKYNPMLPIEVPKQKEFAKKEVAILSDNELQKFIIEATRKFSNGQYHYRIGWAYVLMLYTGLRVGELIALKWSDIDEAGKSLKVTGNIVIIKNRNRVKDDDPVYVNIEQTAKTQASQNRVVPLCNKALEAVNKLKEINGNYDYICSSENNTPVSKRNFDRAYRHICERSGIEPTGLHSLRHTFASLLFRKGADIKTVSEILGHSDTKITYNTYVHLIPEQKINAVALLDEM